VVVSGKGLMTLGRSRVRGRTGPCHLEPARRNARAQNIGAEELRIVVIEVESQPETSEWPR